MSVRGQYPLLWRFFDAAFQSNSGGHADEEAFEDFTPAQMEQAEAELESVAGYHSEELISVLGGMADDGYTLHGMTQQELKEGDDGQHELLAFTLLTTRY